MLRVGVVMKIMHTAGPLVPCHYNFEVEINVAKLKRYKPPGSHQIPIVQIQAGGEILWLVLIHSLILLGIRKIA
jgi:hypothetical protein